MVYGDTIANAISSIGQARFKDTALDNLLNYQENNNYNFSDVFEKDNEMQLKRAKKEEGISALSEGFSTSGKTLKSQFANIDENKNIAKKGLAKAGAVGATALSVAPDAMQLGQLATGKSFDTSAEGGGVGSKGNAMLTGAMSGAKIGMKFGGPVGLVAGALGGALLGKAGRNKAAVEYDENLKKRNIAEDEIIRARREDDYYMASGRESMGALKNLRKKQLGLLNS